MTQLNSLKDVERMTHYCWIRPKIHHQILTVTTLSVDNYSFVAPGILACRGSRFQPPG
jgi:hypothetical protein